MDVDIKKECDVEPIVKQECDDLTSHLDIKCETIETPETVEQSKSTRRKRTEKFKCKECNRKFHKLEYEHHVSNAHPHIDFYYYCDSCTYTSLYRKQLSAHCTLSHQPRVPCYQCSQKFRTNRALKHHEKTHHAKLLKCSNCSFSTKSVCDLEKHLRSHAVQEPYRCLYCTFESPWKLELQKHADTHKSLCCVCSFTTSVQDEFDAHMLMHVTLRSCDFCPFQTVRVELFEIHMQRHGNVKQFTCNYCGLNFAWKSSLRLHEDHHTFIEQRD